MRRLRAWAHRYYAVELLTGAAVMAFIVFAVFAAAGT